MRAATTDSNLRPRLSTLTASYSTQAALFVHSASGRMEEYFYGYLISNANLLKCINVNYIFQTKYILILLNQY